MSQYLSGLTLEGAAARDVGGGPTAAAAAAAAGSTAGEWARQGRRGRTRLVEGGGGVGGHATNSVCIW